MSATERAASLAKSMSLPDDVSAKFIPLYIKYSAKVDAIFKKYPMAAPGQKQSGNDAALKKATDARFAVSRALLELREEYYKKYQKILTPKQIDQLYRAEKRFDRWHNRRFDRDGSWMIDKDGSVRYYTDGSNNTEVYVYDDDGLSFSWSKSGSASFADIKKQQAEARKQAAEARKQAAEARKQAREQAALARKQSREQAALARKQAAEARKQAREQAAEARKQAAEARRQVAKERRKAQNISVQTNGGTTYYYVQ